MSDVATELERRVRERAYYLWEQEGRPEGSAEEFWARATELEAAVPGDQAAIAPTRPAKSAKQRPVAVARRENTATPTKKRSLPKASANTRAKAVDGAASSEQVGQRRKPATTLGGPRQKAGVATESVT